MRVASVSVVEFCEKRLKFLYSIPPIFWGFVWYLQLQVHFGGRRELQSNFEFHKAQFYPTSSHYDVECPHNLSSQLRYLWEWKGALSQILPVPQVQRRNFSGIPGIGQLYYQIQWKCAPDLILLHIHVFTKQLFIGQGTQFTVWKACLVNPKLSSCLFFWVSRQ